MGKASAWGTSGAWVIFPSGNILGFWERFCTYPLLLRRVRTANLCGPDTVAKDTEDF